MRRKPPTTILSRHAWLQHGLERLAAAGREALRVNALCESCGMTKGSFYHHFEGRQDFTEALLGFWELEHNQRIFEFVKSHQGKPEEVLLALAERLTHLNYCTFELPLRALANEEPEAAAVVQRVDEGRLAVVRGLFRKMGFRGRALEMRARAWILTLMAEFMMEMPTTTSERLALVRLRHEMLVRRE